MMMIQVCFDNTDMYSDRVHTDFSTLLPSKDRKQRGRPHGARDRYPRVRKYAKKKNLRVTSMQAKIAQSHVHGMGHEWTGMCDPVCCDDVAVHGCAQGMECLETFCVYTEPQYMHHLPVSPRHADEAGPIDTSCHLQAHGMMTASAIPKPMEHNMPAEHEKYFTTENFQYPSVYAGEHHEGALNSWHASNDATSSSHASIDAMSSGHVRETVYCTTDYAALLTRQRHTSTVTDTVAVMNNDDMCLNLADKTDLLWVESHEKWLQERLALRRLAVC
jgi:hypothetical protein